MTETPTTELRIEGTLVSLSPKPWAKEKILASTKNFMESYGYRFEGTVVTNPDPTGMALYKVEEVEGLRKQIEVLNEAVKLYDKTATINNVEFAKVFAQLEQKEKELRSRNNYIIALENELQESEADEQNFKAEITAKDLKIKSLETRLRLKEETRWKTFIKWVKNL